MRETNDNINETTEAINQTETPQLRVIQGYGANGSEPDNSQPDNSTGRCLAFAEAVRQLGVAVRAQGLAMPSFRSPPKAVGRRRTISRHDDGSATVAVMVRNRRWVAVLADMIEGVVVANRLEGLDAEVLRDHLWDALEGESAQSDTG